MYRLLGLDEGSAEGILTAMKSVATQGGTLPFEGSSARMIKSAATHLLHVEADPDDLPVQLTANQQKLLRQPHVGRAAIDCALLIPLVGEQPQAPDRLAAVKSLAENIGLDDTTTDLSFRLLNQHDETAKADIGRRSLLFKLTDDPDPAPEEISTLLGSLPQPDTLRTLETLATMPEGSLGSELKRYYDSTGFDLPMYVKGTPWLLAQHDVHHVLSSYDTGIPGEIYISAFTAGVSKRRALDYLAVILLLFHHCVELSPGKQRAAAFDEELYAIALERGASCTVDVTVKEWDLTIVLERDLDELRTSLNIKGQGTVAGDGRYDWQAHPTGE